VTAFSGREAERMRGWESAAVILSEDANVAESKDLALKKNLEGAHEPERRVAGSEKLAARS